MPDKSQLALDRGDVVTVRQELAVTGPYWVESAPFLLHGRWAIRLRRQGVFWLEDVFPALQQEPPLDLA